MRIAVEILRRATGAAPVGWYTGRDSPNTRRLVVEHGGFLYDSDYYGDDLPFWTDVTTADGALAPAPRRPLHAGHQRHALRNGPGLQQRRAVLRVSARCFRCALRRRRGAPEDAVDRHALPAPGPAGPLRCAPAVSRSRRAPRPGLDLPPRRHRAALDRAASVFCSREPGHDDTRAAVGNAHLGALRRARALERGSRRAHPRSSCPGNSAR